jgi:hypothetical protein
MSYLDAMVAQPLVRPGPALVLAVAGVLVGSTALAAYVEGPPHTKVLEVLALIAVAALPASIIFTVPVMALGLLLLPFRATRGSGVVLSAYTGAYFFGLLVGAALFWFGRDV